jgi:uncharacterized protein
VKRWVYQGRWALVTGASAGLGTVFAERLAGRGMGVVLTARRGARLEELATRLRDRHRVPVGIVVADLGREGEAERLWREAGRFGRIDLLVNNAGFGAQGRFDEVPLETHLTLLRLNCGALLELTHRALEEMRPRADGAIVNVASVAAYQPVPSLASYAASKAFVLSLTEALWAENRSAGVRILALSPGRTPTEFQEVAGTGSAEGAFGFRTPEQVVDSALRALERGRVTEIPGFENRAATWAVRALPRGSVVRLMKWVTRVLWKR